MTKIPPEILEKYAIEKVFGITDPKDRMLLDVARFVHENRWLDAGLVYATHVRKTKDQKYPTPKDKAEVVVLVTQLVHWCLNNHRYWIAARLLWTESQFDPRPRFARDVFEAWENHAAISLMGSASASKSYSSGVWLLLDWIRDPDFTCIKVLGPSEQHLRDNLFTHLMNLHESASIPLPGDRLDMFIGMDRKNRFGSISGVVVPLGQTRAGRLQGSKAGNKKRKTPHPIFGITGRLRVFMDESEKIPPGIWKDVDNVFANLTGVETFKIGIAFNPENQNGESALRSEPAGGWKNFDIDKDYKWKSKRGWWTVRLDAATCENVVEGHTIFPGLQTKEGLAAVIENAGGYSSPGYYTMARAMFPPTSAELTVITQAEIDNAIGTFVFVGRTLPFGSLDLALEGGDAAPFTLGEFGEAAGFKRPPSLKHPQGEFVQFKNADGEQILRPALQMIQQFKLEKGDSVFMASQIKKLCERCEILPKCFIMDRTGNGQGTFDILANFWEGVRGVNYSEAASPRKIMQEDKLTCEDEYDRVHSELYFAFKKWLRHGLVLFLPGMDISKLAAQLTGRLYATGKVNRIEKKQDYKNRNGGKSPDEADSATLLVHVVREETKIVPSIWGSTQNTPGAGGIPRPPQRKPFVYTDPSNRLSRD